MHAVPALLAAAALSAPAVAQTPVPVSVANDLRACITGENGFRDGPRLGDLDASLKNVPNRRWPNVTQPASGVIRLSSDISDIVIEFRLPDEAGTAHCFAFGRSLGSGQGAEAADTFVEFGFVQGFVPTDPRPGITRRYVFPAIDYTVELIAFNAEGFGEVVGFQFAGIPDDIQTRQLSAGDPEVASETVAGGLGWIVATCLQHLGDPDTLATAFEAGGMEFGYRDGGTSGRRTYFSPDDAVSATFGPGTCQIDTRYLGASEATPIVGAALNQADPGRFQPAANSGRFECAAFFSGGMGVRIRSVDEPQSCAQDGTARITFETAG